MVERMTRQAMTSMEAEVKPVETPTKALTRT